MEKHHSKYLILILLIIAIAAGLTAYFAGSNQPKIANIPKFIPETTPAPAKPTLVVAPDGKKTLSMRLGKTENGATQTFAMAEKDSDSFNNVFSKTVADGATITIPFNTFSPDDKYFFLKETNGTAQNYFVLASSGSPVATDSQTISVSDLFAKKITDYDLKEVTGWAAPTLLVINTTTKDGNIGPSFWFDMSTKSFIRLSSIFH